MSQSLNPFLSDALCTRIRSIEQAGQPPLSRILPFAVPAIDAQLPDGGLAIGGLHEIAAAGNTAADVAAATLFAASIVARRPGPVLWCLPAHDLFTPRLSAVGLAQDRLIFAEAGSEKAVYLLVEAGLRHGGLAGIVGEVSQLPLTAARRLQRAAEGSDALALMLWRGAPTGTIAAASDASPLAVTRWRIAAIPSASEPRAACHHWTVNLIRCRGGEPASWCVDGCDAAGRLALSAEPLSAEPLSAAPREEAPPADLAFAVAG